MGTARQPAGIPVGGQFAATTHSDPAVTLDEPAATRQHNPDHHALLMKQAWKRQVEVAHLLRDQDRISMEAVSSAILRDFPTATELRVRQNFGERGKRYDSTIVCVRDKDGVNITEGIRAWDLEPGPTGGDSAANAFSLIRSQFFDYENDFDFDRDNGEIIVPLNRDYALGIPLI
ncbi:hypothetical protein [Arthrobacter sp. UYCo732]|uniref:hypothetical protein n=1 Tax=Arthrobacter sp. UYCo732 TaxID=3156336 RepID=UPI003394D8A1